MKRHPHAKYSDECKDPFHHQHKKQQNHLVLDHLPVTPMVRQRASPRVEKRVAPHQDDNWYATAKPVNGLYLPQSDV